MSRTLSLHRTVSSNETASVAVATLEALVTAGTAYQLNRGANLRLRIFTNHATDGDNKAPAISVVAWNRGAKGRTVMSGTATMGTSTGSPTTVAPISTGVFNEMDTFVPTATAAPLSSDGTGATGFSSWAIYGGGGSNKECELEIDVGNHDYAYVYVTTVPAGTSVLVYLRTIDVQPMDVV